MEAMVEVDLEIRVDGDVRGASSEVVCRALSF
jgi:hypothetical protein